MKRVIIFIVACVLAIVISHKVAEYVIFGLLTLMGLIALVETITILKWIVYRSSKLLDIIMFVMSVVAGAKLGVTVTAALIIATLGFSMAYRPWIEHQMKQRKR